MFWIALPTRSSDSKARALPSLILSKVLTCAWSAAALVAADKSLRRTGFQMDDQFEAFDTAVADSIVDLRGARIMQRVLIRIAGGDMGRIAAQMGSNSTAMTGRIPACTIPASIPPPLAKSTMAIGASSGRTGFIFVLSKFLQTSNFGDGFLDFAFLIKVDPSSNFLVSRYG
ncbi:hypothetical protein [uncultured Nostoc sp.]|uniref:hypothetical protein n=1 Tax=uncultured Nostoc sp. TaxID=340711 RepID=UPI0035C9B4F6